MESKTQEGPFAHWAYKWSPEPPGYEANLFTDPEAFEKALASGWAKIPSEVKKPSEAKPSKAQGKASK